jgi:two-component system chemotaxis response regulator CheB
VKEETPYLSLNVGELIVSGSPLTVTTVLGSCVSVCLFSRNGKGGGIIHYALPQVPGHLAKDEALRYGEYAIAALICELKRVTGEELSAFQAKVVGGAVEEQANAPQAGLENVILAKQMLSDATIPIVGEAVGGSVGRKVIFHIPSGRLQVAKLTPEKKASVRRRRVLIVDDSKVVRDLLARILADDSDLEIVGFASDPFEAQKMLASARPDVITLDIHMPHMTGVEWLAKLLPQNPLPVVMISSLQLQEGGDVLKALELGAVDYIQKPSLHELAFVGPVIREKVKVASYAKVSRHKSASNRRRERMSLDMRKILAIGASTGGTEALKSVLMELPERIPPTVIVQHIPAVFSKAYAERLNQLCPFDVKEAEDGDELRESLVLIAPGGKHMKLEKKENILRVRITDDPPVNRHKPSVDYLFNSVASLMGKNSVGVILTGMGADGARGLLEMSRQGAFTIGQDEASCVVYGMPRAAFEIGAVQKVAALSNVAEEILLALDSRKAA